MFFLGTWLSVVLLRYLDGIHFEFQTINRPFCKKSRWICFTINKHCECWPLWVLVSVCQSSESVCTQWHHFGFAW